MAAAAAAVVAAVVAVVAAVVAAVAAAGGGAVGAVAVVVAPLLPVAAGGHVRATTAARWATSPGIAPRAPAEGVSVRTLVSPPPNSPPPSR